MPTETRPTVPGSPVRPPRLRSPLARAVVPVLGGIAVIALIFGGTWVVALFISSGGTEQTSRLAPPTFSAGSAERRAESIAEDGPILFPGLGTTSGERTLVMDHDEDADARSGWDLYWAYPADRGPDCPVVQVRGTDRFTDCEGRQVTVEDLARPEGVSLSVDDGVVNIDLRGAVGADT